MFEGSSTFKIFGRLECEQDVLTCLKSLSCCGKNFLKGFEDHLWALQFFPLRL